jgi:hypothetical protein
MTTQAADPLAKARLAKESKRQSLLSDSRIKTASINPKEAKLCSGIRPLDEFLHGGLAFSNLIELGMPFGNGGRRLTALFLAKATSGQWDGRQKLWCLWVSARQQLDLYPPAWISIGVDLHYLRFARSQTPLIDLKPIFTDSFFRVLVFDGVSLSNDDCRFLSIQARSNRQLIILLKDDYLSRSQSNISARLRLNITRHSNENLYTVESIRGVCRKPQLTMSLLKNS